MSEDIVGVNATLPAAIVDAANANGTIEPVKEGETAVRMAGAYPGMAGGQKAHLFIQPEGAAKVEIDVIAIRANQTAAPYIFVELAVFAQYESGTITVFWEIRSGTQLLHTTRELILEVKAGFEAPHTMNLVSRNYGVFSGKPPAVAPTFARYLRVADWAVGSVNYLTDDTSVATIDQGGELTAHGNGVTLVSASDSLGQTRSYRLTVTGILQFRFLSPSAPWQGAKDVCNAAGLEFPPRIQLIQLINTYLEHRGSLTDHLNVLPYACWTSDLDGANTASIVHLDKPLDDDLDPNPSSADLSEHHQVMGVSRV